MSAFNEQWNFCTCLFWMSITHTKLKVLINLPLCPDRVLELPLTDLSFEDREISLSQGELSIFDHSSLLEFNLLVCRLGWVEGDWPDWLGWMDAGCNQRLWAIKGEKTLTSIGDRTETHTYTGRFKSYERQHISNSEVKDVKIQTSHLTCLFGSCQEK